MNSGDIIFDDGDDFFTRRSKAEQAVEQLKIEIAQSENTIIGLRQQIKELEREIYVLDSSCVHEKDRADSEKDRADSLEDELMEALEENDLLVSDYKELQETAWEKVMRAVTSLISLRDIEDLVEVVRMTEKQFPFKLVLQCLRSCVNEHGCWCSREGGVHTHECHTVRNLLSQYPQLFEDNPAYEVDIEELLLFPSDMD